MLEIIILIVVGLGVWSYYTNKSQTKVYARRGMQKATEAATASAVFTRDISKAAKAYADVAKEKNKAKDELWNEILRKEQQDEDNNLKTSVKDGLDIGQNFSFETGLTSMINDLAVERANIVANPVENREKILKEELARIEEQKKAREARQKELAEHKRKEKERLDRMLAKAANFK